MSHDEPTVGDRGPAAIGEGREPGGARSRIEPRLWALLGATFFTMSMTVGQITILGKQVYDMTGSEFDLGLLGLAEFVPVVLLVPLSGMVADRFDRRKVYAFGLAGEMLASVGLYAYVASSPSSVLPIFGLAVCFGTARAFLTAASRSLPVDLAPPGALERMVALNVAAWQAGFIVGPVAFGFVFVQGPALPYLVSAAAAAAAIGCLAIVPSSGVGRAGAAPAAGARAAMSRALEGLRFIRGNRVLLGVISLDLFAVLFGGAVALLPAIAEKRLGVGAVGLGWLRAAVGIGASAMMIVMSVRPVRRGVGTALMSAVAVFGAGTILLGLTRSFALAFAALVVLSGADAVSVFVRSTIVPLATPESMRGRVTAVEYVFVGGSNELGAFESGVAGSLIGVAGAVVFGGVATLVVVAAWWFIFPEVRRIDRFSQVRPDP